MRSAPLTKLVIETPPASGEEMLRQNHCSEKPDFSHNLGLEKPEEAPEATDAAIPREEASGDDGHRN